jgi:mannosyltransferase
MDNRYSQITIAALLLILLLALVLRFYHLDAQSLWNDEGTSVAIAQRGLVTIARDAAHDIHPPLYYWLLSGWVRLVGTSEVAVRSLSALLGVALVALTYALGRLLRPQGGRWAGLAAALVAAINPFQVYYSQEARMYMLLAVWGALAFYAALIWAASERGEGVHHWSIVYVLASVAGLYTHYAFPMVLLVINLTILLDILLQGLGHPTMVRRAQTAQGDQVSAQPTTSSGQALSAWRPVARLWRWLALQTGVVLLFAPWLPTAYSQLTTWPAVVEPPNLIAAWITICQWFSTGPAAPPWGEMGWVLLLFLLLFYPARGHRRLPGLLAYLTPVLWLVVPVLLILGLGLFKEAYLKFLLVASPAPCLLAGRLVTAALPTGRRASSVAVVLLGALVALLVLGASVYGLYHYYNNPAYARDDYRGIAAYVDATGKPCDAILLNAPGQHEVFGYYYHGDLPVYPLPETRPLDPAATEIALEGLTQPGGRVFAVLWATDESDPERFIEGWLDRHAYKALDSWYGNVRLAVYSVPERMPAVPDRILNASLHSSETEDEITLLGYSLLNDRLAAGDIAQITLFWQAGRAPTLRYKVFLHVLDAANHIIGQRDAEPGGGVQLTTLWAPGDIVADNHGLPIHPATPPGEYRVEVGMYNLDTGHRLVTGGGESQVWLEPLAVERPLAPPPVAALGMQHAQGADFGELALLGYDAYRLGFAGQPDLPLRPGDVLRANLYWRARVQPAGDWRVSISVVDSGGWEWAAITAEPIGGYPTGRWQEGDVWRGQFDLVVPGDAPPGRYRIRVGPIAPDGTRPDPFLSRSLDVEH